MDYKTRTIILLWSVLIVFSTYLFAYPNILLIKILKNTSVTRPLELDYKLLHKDRYFFYKRLH